MEDRFAKYSKLYFLIFLLFLAVPVTFGLVIGALYGVSKLVSSHPVDIAFEMLVLCLPPAVLGSAYLIFYKRTAKHPARWVRILSRIVFIIGLCSCVYALAFDIMDYFNIRGRAVTEYIGYAIWFLAGNIGSLFVIAIIQALSYPPEKDYMEKRNKEHTPLI